jgi:ribosome maturation factor RimP
MDKEGLIGLLEPRVNALGYELVDLDFRSGNGGLLRLFIDKDPAVTLDDCQFVSQQIGDLLDVENPIASDYVLEVSSPGLDRRLRTVAHFAAAIGSEIKVELKRGIDGRRRFRGQLTAADGKWIDILCDGKDWQLPLADVSIARLVPAD